MIKQTLTFENFNGEQETDDFYFNLTKGEMAMMEASEKGGLTAYAQRIIKENDNRKLVALFKELIQLSYGIRTDEGKKFVKSEEIYKDFESSGAYSELIMKLLGVDGAAAEFMQGLMPASMQADAQQIAAQTQREIASGKSPSQIAREQSQANLQGHKQPRQKAEPETVTQVVPQQLDVPQSTVDAVADANVQATYSNNPLEDPEYKAFVAQREAARQQAVTQADNGQL